MSAMAALMRRDGGPLDGAAWAGMKAAAWGPLREWAGDALAMAATQVHAGERIAVAADARIDNRGALREALGNADPTANDAALIAAAYARWGADCVERLLGDFAFLLWDMDQRLMLGARDPLGVRPFYYHSGPGLFATASSLAALAPALPGRTPDEAHLADFVAGTFTARDDTAWREARRLPPGHMLLLTGDDVRIRRYWALDPAREVAPANADEEFRALLEEAIHCRLPEGGRSGFMLSGGLDSSSIAALAARMPGLPRPLPALSMTLETLPQWSDGRYLADMLAGDAFAATRIAIDGLDPLADIDAILDEQQQPFLGYNHAASRWLYGVARAQGLRALFDGHGGDETVSQGVGRLNELARAGQWRQLWRQARGIAAIYHMPTWKVASPYADHIRPVRAVRRRLRRWSGTPARPPAGQALVAPALAERIGLAERQRAARPPRHSRDNERDLHVATIEAAIQPHAFEVLANSAAAAGIAPLYPFADKRLVEFCVALPAQEKLDHGLPRYVMRQAMRGILPESVRLRRDKFDFLPTLAAGLAPHAARIERMIAADAGGIGAYVDRDSAMTAIGRLKAQGARTPAEAVFAAWRVAVLGRWLERSAG